MRWKVSLFVAVVPLLYFASAAWIIRNDLGRLLFPTARLTATTSEAKSYRVAGNKGEMLIRQYGTREKGCVLFFPGRHGGTERYERTLFPSFTSAGIEVFSVSYPGQDGASGPAEFESIQGMLSSVMEKVGENCPPENTVVVGRSLGAMLALYAATDARPAGILLEGMAPSLSSALHSYLSKKWYLSPLSALPIERLLRHNFSLAEGLRRVGNVPVALFQGTSDSTTPIEPLEKALESECCVEMHAVQDATHSNAYVIANKEYVSVVVSMLAGGLRKLAKQGR